MKDVYRLTHHSSFTPKTQTICNYLTQTQWLSASHSLLCSLSASTLLHKTWSKLTKRNLAAKKTTRSAARKKTKSAARRKIRSLARRVAWTTAKRNATKRRVAAANKVVATKRAATRNNLVHLPFVPLSTSKHRAIFYLKKIAFLCTQLPDSTFFIAPSP